MLAMVRVMMVMMRSMRYKDFTLALVTEVIMLGFFAFLKMRQFDITLGRAGVLVGVAR